jgi:hypothetical protein
MKRISFKGVVIGNIADVVSTHIFLIPLMMYFLISSRGGLSSDHAAGSVTEILLGNTAFTVWSSILGGLGSALGGYVSARIAKHDEVLNGALSSVLSAGAVVYSVISGSAADHLWHYLVFLPLSPALAGLGGYLRSRNNGLED